MPDPRLPVTDRDSKPWWDALARHELVLQRCDGCGHRRWPARELCGHCGSLRWAWERAGGEATVASWIVTLHSFSPSWPTPSVVVLARLTEQDDVLIPGAYEGPSDGHGLAMGLPLVAGFDDVAGDDGQVYSLLRWRRR